MVATARTGMLDTKKNKRTNRPEPEFWRGRRVLITGHTGFKGCWMSAWLVKMGSIVTGLSLDPQTNPAMFDLLGLKSHMTSRIGDIRDVEVVQKAVNAAEPEIIIHMAAQALVRRSYEEPIETFQTNVMGTAHVLEAARESSGLKAVVVVTSDKCYENREWSWGYRENDAMGGHDPYSASKGCAELVTASYQRSFGDDTCIASVRAGNVIGGGDWSTDRLIPDVVRAITEDKAVAIRNPGAIRPWQHVLEPISGYLVLAERLFLQGSRFVGAWNFGPNISDTLPVSEVVSAIAEKLGSRTPWNFDDQNHPHEAHCLRLDISKAVGELGYQPSLPLDTALDWTAEWYRACSSSEDMFEITLQQIERFERVSQSTDLDLIEQKA